MKRDRNPHIDAFDSEAEVLERLNLVTVSSDDEPLATLREAGFRHRSR